MFFFHFIVYFLCVCTKHIIIYVVAGLECNTSEINIYFLCFIYLFEITRMCLMFADTQILSAQADARAALSV